MRGKLISAIHVAKRELALDDETYTFVLLAATGKTSCRDMSADELSRVLDVF
ncbi:phage protein GemA/Gp16 family protein, partial [Escherichia coli]